jgi:transposase
VVEIVRQPPALHRVMRSRWRLADLRAVVPWLATYSVAGISRVLRRLQISRQRGRLAVHSPDPADAVKLAWVARARGRAGDSDAGLTVVYGDEFSLRRQPTLGPTYGPRGHEPVARLAAGTNRYYRSSAALDPTTGRVTWLGRSRMGKANLTRFLVKLRQAYPTGRLVLIWDNWPPHQRPVVLEAASILAIEVLWLPTYAPWTNPTERLWRWLTEDLLRHHRLADRWETLRQQVAAWLDRFAGPSPALLRYAGLVPD